MYKWQQINKVANKITKDKFLQKRLNKNPRDEEVCLLQYTL